MLVWGRPPLRHPGRRHYVRIVELHDCFGLVHWQPGITAAHTRHEQDQLPC